jgi:hypothetical protein
MAPALGWQAPPVRRGPGESFRHGEAVLQDKPQGGRPHAHLTRQQEQEGLAPLVARPKRVGCSSLRPGRWPRSRRWAARFTRRGSPARCLGREDARSCRGPKHPKASEAGRGALKKTA